jgi:integrase
MPRQRIISGTVGPVSVVPLGYDTSDSDQTEVTIPRPSTRGGETLPYPKGMKVGSAVKVELPDGVREYVVRRWRGLARAVDIDGTEHMIRRWRDTRAAAEAATRVAGEAKLRALDGEREAAASAAASDAQGDVATTVADLVAVAITSPAFVKLAPRTRDNYRYASGHITDHPLGAMLPRNVDVAAVRRFLVDTATAHGKGGAKHSRALLVRALDIAVETAAMRTPFNAASGVRNAIPSIVVRQLGIDHKRAPTDDEVRKLLAGLTRDPEARAMYPGTARRKSPHGQAGTLINGKDVADLAAVLFASGGRLGEIAALRWCDFDPEAGTVSISGTLVARPESGTTRQEGTKTKGSARVVPLTPWALAALLRRARRFGVTTTDGSKTPIFGSPQHPQRFRDYRNLTRSVATLFARHGVDFARGHAARKWRITSLVEKGVPIHMVADVVGHVSIATTNGYLGRGRQTDDAVLVALGRQPRR